MTHSLDDALVEKVARAIAGVCFETGWDDLAEDTRACFFPYARAALEAAGVAELREENERLQSERSFIWKWIERAHFDWQLSDVECLNTLLHYPGAPWNSGQWDVEHKRYAECFYKMFPKARAALTNQGKAQP